MGCGSCSSGGGCGTKVGGCKSNGGCSTGGCNRLNVYDWLSDMEMPTSFEEFDIVEVRFKGGRKDFYRNTNKIALITGEPVVVEVPNGQHVGYVSLKGELVRLQMLKKKVDNNEEIKSIYRIATEKDLEKLEAVKLQENGTMYRARQIIQELSLKMKLSDVEYQADKTKATFYYSAEDRVDFRDLIKKLADEFKIRVEMRQISLRHEAGRLGGIGSCGRELCCSTWLTDFKSVSTTAARYQNLSLNPSKLSGQCGRLKCCLNYELETYMDALKDIPTVNRPLQTQKGEAFLQKTDIFKKIMWFGFRGDNNWHPVPVARVKEIQKINSDGQQPENLVEAIKEPSHKELLAAQLEGSLERLDDKFKSKGKKKKKKKPAGLQSLVEGVQRAAEIKQQNRPKVARSERPERPQKQTSGETRPERSERPERAEGTENRRPNRENRGPRPERTPRPERPERAERSERPEQKRENTAEGATAGDNRPDRANQNRNRNRNRNFNKPRPPKPTE
ncbi:regulatory iron-sulfur-containing complex subunit RicT [Adhaeribacter terreus]|uniref:Regulatory iron-sulfur-containing complex subunit RicT n=1 Tax=Adhaeribacter terreus TaxID=529703 RepID=A0ABW0EB83_9BACT